MVAINIQRLDKLIADSVCISRKDAKVLINEGKVKINDLFPKKSDEKISECDKVTLNGELLDTSPHVYIMLNKPQDVVSATIDKNCKTVIDILPESLIRKGLFPAGRLDKDTEGFVLITDDGVFAHKILSPKNHVPKTYRVTLEEPADKEKLSAIFALPMDLGDKDISSPAILNQPDSTNPNLFDLIIFEGFYHQVKRMFKHCGCNVSHLARTHIGGLKLDDNLQIGHARKLTAEEVLTISTIKTY